MRRSARRDQPLAIDWAFVATLGVALVATLSLLFGGGVGPGTLAGLASA